MSQLKYFYFLLFCFLQMNYCRSHPRTSIANSASRVANIKFNGNAAEKSTEQANNQIQLPSVESLSVAFDLDTRGGGGWTVIQRRMDGSVDFYRPWADYKNGFGNKFWEFWLGLDGIHQLTSQEPHELLIMLEDFDNVRKYAFYDEFKVANETEKYKLTLGNYSGDAGNSLILDNAMMFSTFDNDNANWAWNCAKTFKGAWWYNACGFSNLNGLYRRGEVSEIDAAKIVYWNDFRGSKYSLKLVEMMIRPKSKIL